MQTVSYKPCEIGRFTSILAVQSFGKNSYSELRLPRLSPPGEFLLAIAVYLSYPILLLPSFFPLWCNILSASASYRLSFVYSNDELWVPTGKWRGHDKCRGHVERRKHWPTTWRSKKQAQSGRANRTYARGDTLVHVVFWHSYPIVMIIINL